MELNHLRYFYEVAKAGSFTKAARDLHISQSSLSKAVALLEEAEGVRLFERSKTGVALTTLGAEVYKRSEEIFRTLQEIENTCRGKKEVVEGRLRFGASDHVTNYLLIQIVCDLQKIYPKLVPSISAAAPSDIIAGLLTNEIEFGLFFTQLNIPQIVYEPILTVEMAVVCRSDLLSGSKDDMSMAELRSFVQKHGYISSIRSQYQSSPSEELLKIIGTEPNVIFEANSQEAQKRFCLEGGGVAFLARFMVEEELKKGKLTKLPTKKPISLNLYLARRKGRTRSVGATALIEAIATFGKSNL